eukprot:TRINITY_DN2646_c0_g3_i1.p1 TRINITY_DN2646_c0_g3~~TRINITY_DN2646_c0_g3_i1.p1  ORF type:complete len:843 (-),score=107.52 TRINITY_DN2646_c0_g3_i1:249-2777(-)
MLQASLLFWFCFAYLVVVRQLNACDTIKVTNLRSECTILTQLLSGTNDRNEIEYEIINDINQVLSKQCCKELEVLQSDRCLCDSELVQQLNELDEFTLYLLQRSLQFECGLTLKLSDIRDCQSQSNEEGQQDQVLSKSLSVSETQNKQLVHSSASHFFSANDSNAQNTANVDREDDQNFLSVPEYEQDHFTQVIQETSYSSGYMIKTPNVISSSSSIPLNNDAFPQQNSSNEYSGHNGNASHFSHVHLPVAHDRIVLDSYVNKSDYSAISTDDHVESYEYEEGVYRKGDLVLKSADEDEVQLEKEPYRLEPEVEELFRSEAVATYVDWAVTAQSQRHVELEFSAIITADQQIVPQEEHAWQYRVARADCGQSVLTDMANYKDCSIISQCLRQAQKTLVTEDYVVLVAPHNAGFMQWLGFDANMTLIEFFSDIDKMTEVVGRHVAFGQPLNLKGMKDGSVINLHSMQGTLLTISLKNKEFSVNGIKIETFHASCDGIIMVVQQPIPEPQITTRTQQPQIQSGLESLIPLLMFPDEQGIAPAQPQFKLNSMDLFDATQEVSGQQQQQQQQQVPYQQQGQPASQQSQQQQYRQQQQQPVQQPQQQQAQPGLYAQQQQQQQSQYQQQQQSACDRGGLVDVLRNSFSGFAYLASQQGLQEILQEQQDVTIFVPGAVGKGIQIDDYIVKQQLHKRDLAWLGTGAVLNMLSGKQHEVQVQPNGEVLVGGLRLVTWDYEACNGVIHVLEDQFADVAPALENEMLLASPVLPAAYSVPNLYIPALPPQLEGTPAVEISIQLNLPPPPPPLVIRLDSNMSLVKVDDNNGMSTNEIHSLVSALMTEQPETQQP